MAQTFSMAAEYTKSRVTWSITRYQTQVNPRQARTQTIRRTQRKFGSTQLTRAKLLQSSPRLLSFRRD
jgi:hypothetical protein